MMAGVPTFAVPPTFLGLSRAQDEATVHIAGIPFDIGTTNRSGARFGPPAIRQASRMLVDGDHREPDYKQAMVWALKAAEQGVAASMTRVGLLHNNAMGVERDVATAARWWRKAALLGDADGQAMLGAAHHLGAGVAREPVAALAWLMRARAARSPFADRFYAGVRQPCTAEQIREAERRAGLPLESEEAVA